jgi:hypothetical protein
MKAKSKKKPRVSKAAIIKGNLKNIPRALLEGEKRVAFLEFLKKSDAKNGLYTLYDDKGRLYYAGKASDLIRRLAQHLKDRHADSWTRMTLFFLTPDANISQMEGLIVAAANPPGNKQKPRIGNDLRKALNKHLDEDAKQQNAIMIFPEKKHRAADKINSRITAKKLKKLTQAKIAAVLNITPGRVSQLIEKDPRNYSVLRRYITDAGRRDSILLLLGEKG